jgi:hypothetical protein
MARDGAHIEDVFMDIAGDFVDKLERKENLPSQVANEIYRAIESNLDALLRDFKRSEFYPRRGDITTQDVGDYIFEAAGPDIANQVLREIEREERRAYRRDYRDDRRDYRSRRSYLRTDRGNDVAISNAGFVAAFKQNNPEFSEQRQSEKRRSRNNNEETSRNTQQEVSQSHNLNPNSIARVIGVDDNDIIIKNLIYSESENDSNVREYNQNICFIVDDGSFDNGQYSISYKEIACQIPFYKNVDAIQMINDTVPDTISPAIYFNNFMFDFVQTVKLGGANDVKEARAIIEKMAEQIENLHSMSDINKKIVPIFNLMQSTPAREYLQNLIFKEFNNQHSLFLFRVDNPKQSLEISTWQAFLSMAGATNFAYIESLSTQIKTDLNTLFFDIMLNTLKTLFIPNYGNAVITAANDKNVIVANPGITLSSGKYTVRDCCDMEPELWNNLAERIDNTYLIHKIRRRIVTTNLDISSARITGNACIEIVKPTHPIHVCLKKLWNKPANEVVECPKLIVYTHTSEVPTPIAVLSFGCHVERGYIKITPDKR